jgi:spermidine/putrescine transport system ATP-binding protein
VGREGERLIAEGPGGLRFVARAGEKAAGEGGVMLSLRPEEIRIAPHGAAGEGHEMRVTHRIFLGEHVEYHLRSAALDHLIAVVPRSTDIAGGTPGVGVAVRVSWRDGAALALAED